jgi:uncharacterized protein (TIGR03083 family)
MTDLSTIRAALEESFDALETLGADLTSAEWAFPSLCPDWTVRGVFEHLASIENALISWIPNAADTPPPFNLAGSFVKEVADLDTFALMERVRGVFARRRQDLSVLSPADLTRPSWTPVGPGSYGRFMEIRVFDFWVHERDITTPLGRPTDAAGPRAKIALAEVEGSLGYIVGKKVGLPDGRSIVFHLSGPLGARHRRRRRRKSQGGRHDRPARRGDLDGHAHLHPAGLRSDRSPGTHRSRYHRVARRRRVRGTGGAQSQIHHVSP